MRKYVATRKPHAIHPLVTLLFEEMHKQRICMLDMAEKAGIAISTMHRWKDQRQPTLLHLEACFNVLGMRLDAVYGRERKKQTQE